MNKIIIGVIAVIILAGGYYLLNSRTPEEKQEGVIVDYKNISYMVDGKSITLKNGVAETEIAPGSATKIVTRYFGNEVKTDLDEDGREDVAFIITQEGGGSGTFFYAVAARNIGNRYVGSDGYLLGDRIAPQSTNVSQYPRHKNVVVFNYADRGPGEPMAAQPSVGRSAYLKLNPDTMQWGVVLSPEEQQSL